MKSGDLALDSLFREILTSRVYDVARVTALEPAVRLSERLGTSIPLKREDTWSHTILPTSASSRERSAVIAWLRTLSPKSAVRVAGNSTTDNVTYRHLMNIKRIAYNLD